MVPGRDAEVLGDLPQEVALTIASARAPSTRRAYALKWNLFVEWCSSHREDPRRCSIRAVLSFLQQGLERRLSPSTLKVYVAAISAHHDPVEGRSVGKHDLVVRFLRGARRLNPLRPPSLPSWDLALVLRALQIAPFEPLQSVELNLAASASARGPETGDPEREETAHWEMVTAPLPPPEEGRVEYLVFVPPLARKPAVPKTSLKSGFLILWVPRGGELRAVHHGIASLLLSRQAAGGCPRAPLLPIRGTR